MIWWSLMIVVDWDWARPTPINSNLIWCRIPPIAAKKRGNLRLHVERLSLGEKLDVAHLRTMQPCYSGVGYTTVGRKWSTAIRSQPIQIQPRCKYYVSGRLYGESLWQPCFVMPAIRTAVQGPFKWERVQLVLISGKLQVDTLAMFLTTKNLESHGFSWLFLAEVFYHFRI